MKPGLLLITLALSWTSAPAADDVWTQKELEQVSARIQADVAKIRGVEFKRPVAVSLTDKEGFAKHMRARVEKLVPEGMIESDETTAKLLGLIPPEMDMWAVMGEMLKEQVGGFYDPGADTFYLMDSFTGKVAEIILSHELTHALDDQHFDIDGKLLARIENGDAATAFSAVVEGSGTVLMSTWAMQHAGELSMEDLQEASEMGTEALAAAPPYLWKPLLAAYLQGQRFLQAGYSTMKKSAKGTLNDTITRAFEHPPLSCEQVLHPEKYWEPDERDDPRAIAFELGDLPAGWERTSESVLGELVLALVVADDEEREPIDFENQLAVVFMKFTNDAAAGWDGDRALLLRREGAVALVLATCWDDADEAAEFRAALAARRERVEAGLAAMDAEGAGSGFLLREGTAPDEVVLATWSGAAREEIEAVLAGVRHAVGE